MRPTDRVARAARSTDPGAASSKRKCDPTGQQPKNKRARADQGDSDDEPLQQSAEKPSSSDPPTHGNLGLYLGIDHGTTCLKASYAVVRVINNVLQRPSLSSVKPVEWGPRRELSVPTQIAYKMNSDGALVPIFGHQAEAALATEEIKPEEVISHYKPMLLNGRMKQEADHQREMADLTDHMQSLDVNSGLKAVGKECMAEDPHGVHEIKPVAHYAAFLQYAIHESFKQISTQRADLNLPEFPSFLNMVEYLKGNMKHIRIGLTVPANCEWSLVMAAAISAGIPTPIPLISEPAAAAAFVLTRQSLTGVNVKGKRHMTLDAGGGSADIHTGKCTSVSPFQMEELANPTTKWIGGSEVNSAAAKLVIDGIPKLEQTLKDIKGRRNVSARYSEALQKDRVGAQTFPRLKDYTALMLENELNQSFERAKKRPSNINQRYLPFKGLVYDNFNRSARMRGDAGFLLSSPDLEKIHATLACPLAAMVTETLEVLAEDDPHKGKLSPPLDQITVCGGPTTNSYVQEVIFKKIQDWILGVGGTYSIPVEFVMNRESSEIRPDRGSPVGSTCVAHGAVLLLADERLERERMLHCRLFTWAFEKGTLEANVFEGPASARVPRFITNDRQILHHEHEIPMEAKRLLCVKEKVRLPDGETGWDVVEELCWMKTLDGPSPKVGDGTYEVIPLRLSLSVGELAAVPRRKHEGNTYLIYEYVFFVQFVGTCLQVDILIPRSGVVGEDNDVGDNPICKTFRFTWEGSFYPVGTASRESDAEVMDPTAEAQSHP